MRTISLPFLRPFATLPLSLGIAMLTGIAMLLVGGAPAAAQAPEPAAPSATESASEPSAGPAFPELPTGPVQVTVLELAAPSRFVELTKRFQEALDRNKEWLQTYLHDHQQQPGEPLPWNPNFGLTQEEYDEYLDLSDQIRLRPSGQAKVAITSKGQMVSFDAEGRLSALDEISLDLAQRKVTTPFGDCADFVPVQADAKTQPAGPWNGVVCQSRHGDPQASARTVTFSLGRFVEGGGLYLGYEGKTIENGVFTNRADVFVSIP